MEKFGQNFRGGREVVLCPLCRNHKDGEEESFSTCSETKEKVDIRGSFDEIFRDDIPIETVLTMKRIMKHREKETQ